LPDPWHLRAAYASMAISWLDRAGTAHNWGAWSGGGAPRSPPADSVVDHERVNRQRGAWLLLLLLRLILDDHDVPVSPPLGNRGEHGDVDLLHLLVERGDRLLPRRPRDDLGIERFLGIAAVDALVGWHVVIVPAMSDDHVSLVDRAIVRGIERDPAYRRRVELDPRVALSNLPIVGPCMQVPAHVAAGGWVKGGDRAAPRGRKASVVES